MAGQETISREVRLRRRPQGVPVSGDFVVTETRLPPPRPGEVLIRNRWLSVDPYMRNRMDGVDSYVTGFKLDEALTGGAIGQVLEANAHPRLKAGDWVRSGFGWREAFVSDSEEVEKIDPVLGPPEAYLGALGMPGMTAYEGLLEHGRLKAGETVFVSGAAGAVGSVVCQIARIKGCRVVGSAGSPAKVEWLKRRAKVDAAIDYRACGDLDRALAEACPEGIDVYYDNVGGRHLEAALGRMRLRGRIVMCGAISRYNDARPVPGPSNLFLAVGRRLTLQGFIVDQSPEREAIFLADMARWIAEGRMVWDETVVDGLERMPEAMIGLFRGDNLGKMLVRLPE